MKKTNLFRLNFFFAFIFLGCSSGNIEINEIDLKKDFNEDFNKNILITSSEDVSSLPNKDSEPSKNYKIKKNIQSNKNITNHHKVSSKTIGTSKAKVKRKIIKKVKKPFYEWSFATEMHKFSVSFMGMDVGNLTLEVKKDFKSGGMDAHLFTARIQTNDVYDYIYPIDDSVESYVNRFNFAPIKTSINKKEGKKTVSSLQLHDLRHGKLLYFEKKTKKGKTTKFKSKIEAPKFFQDVLSMIYYIRFVDISKLPKTAFTMILKNKIYKIKVVEARTEKVKLKREWKEAIIIKVESFKDGKKKRKGNVELVISNDKYRVLYSINGYLKIGHLVGKLVSYERN